MLQPSPRLSLSLYAALIHLLNNFYAWVCSFSYPEPFLRAVNGARRGALAKSISNWHLIGHNEGYCSNTRYILLPCFYGIRLWIWPEPLVAPRVRRALGTRMGCAVKQSRNPNLQSSVEACLGSGKYRRLLHENQYIWIQYSAQHL